jgi:exopolysaccharide biosynthesis polyprenyl glycosylphosphotransferase
VVALGVAWTAPVVFSDAADWERRVLCAALAVVVTLLTMHRAGLYRARVCALRSSEVARTIAASVLGAGVFASGEWLAGSSSAWPAIVGAGAASVAVLVVRWRFGRWLKAKRAKGLFLRTVVLVGTNEDGAALWSMLRDEPELGYRVGAVLGPHALTGSWQAVDGCTEIGGLEGLARRAGATGVIVVGSAWGAPDSSEVVGRALRAGFHVQIWPGFSGLSSHRIRMAPVSGVPMLYVEPHDGTRWRSMVKRAMDMTLTVALFPLAAPVLIVAAIWIKLEDGGPVIHRHSVIGRFGVPITVLKLRTMVPNAEQMIGHVAALNERTGGPLFKATHDPRVTRIGRLLRATSIDELPQLWNVLNGTMSLVGPRFALPYEVEQFDEELRRRHDMRPGITGLWQSEARDNPSFSVYRRLDLFYVDNWTLLMDVGILVNTAHATAVRFVRTVLARPAPASPPPDTAAEQASVAPAGELSAPELATSDQV